jgi:hypothetical protein
VAFIVVNILDFLSTIIGISSGKAGEMTIILVQIYESHGLVGISFVKIGLSVLLVFLLSLKYYWKSNIWTKSVTTGLWIGSLMLLPFYMIIMFQNILILL